MDLAGVYRKTGLTESVIACGSSNSITLKADNNTYEYRRGSRRIPQVPNSDFVSYGSGDRGKFIVCRNGSDLFFCNGRNRRGSIYKGYGELYLGIDINDCQTNTGIPVIVDRNNNWVGKLLTKVDWLSVAKSIASENIYSDKMFCIKDLSGQSDYIIYHDSVVGGNVDGILKGDKHFSLLKRSGFQRDVSLDLVTVEQTRSANPFISDDLIYISNGRKTFFWTSVMGDYGIACNTKDARIVYTGCSFLFEGGAVGVYSVLLSNALRTML